MNLNSEINAALIEGGGLLHLRDCPALAPAVRRKVSQGQLIRILPGIYSTIEASEKPFIWMHAVMARFPDAVLVGAAAARCTFWPDAPMTTIKVAAGRRKIAPQPRYQFTQRLIPADLIIEHRGLRFTTPALTAIDLADRACADAVDIALRSRATTLDHLWSALEATKARTGNVDRRSLLLDSRDEPWSAAERVAHRLLRGANITGWVTNLAVAAGGRLYYVDIAFKRQRLVIEIDGRIHQLDEKLFHSDRRRQNALILDGWRVLRFTWRMLEDHPDVFITEVGRAVRPSA